MIKYLVFALLLLAVSPTYSQTYDCPGKCDGVGASTYSIKNEYSKWYVYAQIENKCTSNRKVTIEFWDDDKGRWLLGWSDYVSAGKKTEIWSVADTKSELPSKYRWCIYSEDYFGCKKDDYNWQEVRVTR